MNRGHGVSLSLTKTPPVDQTAGLLFCIEAALTGLSGPKEFSALLKALTGKQQQGATPLVKVCNH